MCLYALVLLAHRGARRMPRNQRGRFQLVVALFSVCVLAPQLYVLGRPKSGRYCRQPLLSNLSASIALSLMASGFSVALSLVEEVPAGVWAACHVFGLLSVSHSVCSIALTLTATACAKTTPELYYMSLILTIASVASAGLLVVLGGLWLKPRLHNGPSNAAAVPH